MIRFPLGYGLLLVLASCATWQAPDPHVTPVGFFDLHVCNWPDRPLFFKAVFSTTRFEEVDNVTVFSPAGRALFEFNLGQYKVVRKPGKPLKRVHLVDIPVPPDAANGWYTARVRTRDGREYIARDRVQIRRLGMVSGAVAPPDESTPPIVPAELRWSPVPGTKFYVVFIYDRFDDNKVVFESPRVTEPRAIVPARILQPGGAYAWRVNARDRFEDHEFGDFNHGSLSPEFHFNTPN